MPTGTFARERVRAVAQRVKVVNWNVVRIRGLQSKLLRTLTAASGVEVAVFGFVPLNRNGAPDTIRTCGLHLRRATVSGITEGYQAASSGLSKLDS
jgi:hypothetical protein